MSRQNHAQARGGQANFAWCALAAVVLACGQGLFNAPARASTTRYLVPLTSGGNSTRDTVTLHRVAQAGRPRTCPTGTRGTPPNCARIPPPKKKCPRGKVGKWPICFSIAIPKKCPQGYKGIWPKCSRRVADPPRRCKKGYKGTPPNCQRVTTPPKNGTKTAQPGSGLKRRTAETAGKPVPDARPGRTQGTATNATQRPNEVVVVLDQAVDPNAALAIAQQYRLVRIDGRNIQLISARIQRYRIPDRRSVADVLGELANDPRIRLSQPNFIYRLLGASNAGGTGTKASSKSRLQYALSKLRLKQTHLLTKGRGVRIAVIDSGVDTGHAEFGGAIAVSYNAVRHAAAKADGHGTAVAGVIGARGDLTGIAPASELLAVQAFVREAADGKPMATSFILPHAIDWSIQNGARILNLSFSGPPDPVMEEIINAAIAAGTIVVAAAGNGGPEADAAYPAAYPGVIAVTATDKRDGLYPRANRGTYVAIAAPGVGIFAPVPKGGYDFKTGTSFAAPHVSGLVALMLERRGTLTAKDARAALLNTAVDLGPPGPDTLYGSGRADAFASVEAVIAGKLTEAPRGVALPTRPTGN